MENPFTAAQKFFRFSGVRGDECCLVIFAMGQNRLKSLAQSGMGKNKASVMR
jgi:hypothetical protein